MGLSVPIPSVSRDLWDSRFVPAAACNAQLRGNPGCYSYLSSMALPVRSTAENDIFFLGQLSAMVCEVVGGKMLIGAKIITTRFVSKRHRGDVPCGGEPRRYETSTSLH